MDPELLKALDALVESNKKVATDLGVLVERANKEDADKAAALDESQAQEQEASKPSYADIDKALTEAELPLVSRTAVFAAVEGGADLAESVTAEKARVEAILAESGKSFKGNVSDEGEPASLEETTKAAVANIFGS
jgi:hypothetical protein